MKFETQKLVVLSLGGLHMASNGLMPSYICSQLLSLIAITNIWKIAEGAPNYSHLPLQLTLCNNSHFPTYSQKYFHRNLSLMLFSWIKCFFEFWHSVFVSGNNQEWNLPPSSQMTPLLLSVNHHCHLQPQQLQHQLPSHSRCWDSRRETQRSWGSSSPRSAVSTKEAPQDTSLLI